MDRIIFLVSWKFNFEVCAHIREVSEGQQDMMEQHSYRHIIFLHFTPRLVELPHNPYWHMTIRLLSRYPCHGFLRHETKQVKDEPINHFLTLNHYKRIGFASVLNGIY